MALGARERTRPSQSSSFCQLEKSLFETTELAKFPKLIADKLISIEINGKLYFKDKNTSKKSRNKATASDWTSLQKLHLERKAKRGKQAI